MLRDTLRRIGRSPVWRWLAAFLKWLVKTWWQVWMYSDWR